MKQASSAIWRGLFRLRAAPDDKTVSFGLRLRHRMPEILLQQFEG
jgi:hypothetical protein